MSTSRQRTDRKEEPITAGPHQRPAVLSSDDHDWREPAGDVEDQDFLPLDRIFK